MHPFSSVVLAFGLATAVLVVPEAAAAERSPTWDMSLEELRAIGLGQSQGDPVPVPPDAPLSSPGKPQAAKQGVIFVNFDGAQLSSGWDDSRTNTTQLNFMAGNFAPYGQGAKRDAVLQAVRDDWAAYNVIVTDVRPASGDYTMNMTGPTNPLGGGVLGVAPLDCYDQQTHNNITFAFHSVNDQFSAAVTATTIGQEVAHSYGLEHVNQPGDIMNPYNAGGDASFIDSCIQIVTNGQPIQCGQQHAEHCGTNSAQNAHRELLALFGAAEPDTTAPVVELVYPEDGDTFPPGADFTIVAEAHDDTALQTVLLYNNGEVIAETKNPPYDWGVTSIEEGVYELHVEAIDLAGNAAMSNVVTIIVGDPPQADDTGDTDGNETDSGEAGSAGVETEGGALPPGSANDENDGCGCSTRDDGLSLTLLFLLIPALRRRAWSAPGHR